MMWLGKLVGGTFGFIMGGPLGALLGAALGHQFDRNTADIGLLEADFTPDARQRVRMAFFTATFSTLGHIAKSDGRVTEAEIQAARKVMDRMALSESLRLTAIRLYNEGKRSDFPLDATVEQFYAECRRRYSLYRMFVEIQLEAALADGALHDAKERLLLRLCDRLHFSRFEYRTMKARLEAERRFTRYRSRQQRWERRDTPAPNEPALAAAYAVLDLTSSASGSEIKQAYRRLMSQHHPDKLAASGMPEEMVRLATEKTQQIRKAYDTISKARKL
jgi:DnaJ like chaperone protein